jgi:predicted ester cyclase
MDDVRDRAEGSGWQLVEQNLTSGRQRVEVALRVDHQYGGSSRTLLGRGSVEESGPPCPGQRPREVRDAVGIGSAERAPETEEGQPAPGDASDAKDRPQLVTHPGGLGQWFTVAMNGGTAAYARDVSEEIFGADFVDRDGLETPIRGRATWQAAVIEPIFAAFADIEFRIEQLVAKDDRVAVRYVFFGTHVGTFLGVPATHRRIHHTENEIYRVRGGQIVESWGEGDSLGTLRQLGLVPQPVS